MDKSDFLELILHANRESEEGSSSWKDSFLGEPPAPFGKIDVIELKKFHRNLLDTRFPKVSNNLYKTFRNRKPKTYLKLKLAKAWSPVKAYDKSKVPSKKRTPFADISKPNAPSFSMGIRSYEKQKRGLAAPDCAPARPVDRALKYIRPTSPSFTFGHRPPFGQFGSKSGSDSNIGPSHPDWKKSGRGFTMRFRCGAAKGLG